MLKVFVSSTFRDLEPQRKDLIDRLDNVIEAAAMEKFIPHGATSHKDAVDEFTHTWWILRRMIAWAAKVPDEDMPPIIKGEITKEGKKILSNEVYWDGTLLHQMKNI